MESLLVGTIDGVLRCERKDHSWSVKQHGLRDHEVPCLAVRPDDRNIIYAGTRFGGLCRSIDGGHNWTSIGRETLKHKIRSIAVAPGDPARMYAGTEPAGLFLSEDEGATWRAIPAVAEIARRCQWTYPVPSIEPHIRWIALDPQFHRIFLAGQVGGIVVSDDGGASWRDLRDPIDLDVHSIHIDPQDPQVIYAATGGGERIPYPKGKPLYRSNDGGKTWRSITDDLERHYAVPVKLDPADSQTVYLGCARGTPFSWRDRPSVADGALMRSRDSGITWQQLNEGLPQPLQNMVECIEFDPEDSSTMAIATGGEGARYVKLETSEVYLSSNRGDSWEQILGTLPNICSLAVQ
jgi:photosystem II stability/assembly factor-like uncharacterized protein